MKFNTPGSDGKTRGDIHRDFGQAVPHVPKPANGPEHILDWFWRLNETRSHDEAGPNAITYAEISAWAGLSGIRLKPHQLDAIKALDVAYREEMAEAMKYHRKREERERKKGK